MRKKLKECSILFMTHYYNSNLVVNRTWRKFLICNRAYHSLGNADFLKAKLFITDGVNSREMTSKGTIFLDRVMKEIEYY